MKTSIDIDDFKITPFTELKDLPADYDLGAKKSNIFQNPHSLLRVNVNLLSKKI
jgi:hypothetical protein